MNVNHGVDMKRVLPLVFVAFVLATCYAPLLRGQVPATPGQAPVTTPVPGVVVPAAPGAPSTPAVAVTTVPSPAAPQSPMDAVMWSLAMSYVLRFLMNLKRFTWLTPESSARIKAWAGFFVAAGTAAGIHLAVNGSFLSHGGVGFTVTGLSVDALKDIGFQWASQQAWYEGLVKKVVA